ncbi:MAG: winged helix-turn-helix transcriptional regulator [Deltaproteobacteria bacterium]|nr:winged helix-turn-helix transcriptional regulator [Deltaproteobacteria bacterium]
MRSARAQLDVAPLTRVFKALADETRVRIVALLSHGELCVCHVEEALGLTQPNASRALGILVNAGVLERRREGSWVYFLLAKHPDLLSQSQLQSLARSFAKRDVLRRDVERLLKVRGPGACA